MSHCPYTHVFRMVHQKIHRKPRKAEDHKKITQNSQLQLYLDIVTNVDQAEKAVHAHAHNKMAMEGDV